MGTSAASGEGERGGRARGRAGARARGRGLRTGVFTRAGCRGNGAFYFSCWLVALSIYYVCCTFNFMVCGPGVLLPGGGGSSKPAGVNI